MEVEKRMNLVVLDPINKISKTIKIISKKGIAILLINLFDKEILRKETSTLAMTKEENYSIRKQAKFKIANKLKKAKHLGNSKIN